MKKYVVVILALFVGVSCHTNNQPVENKKNDEVPFIEYRITGRLPHDTLSFTEGLVFHNGQLFESTGSPEEILLAKSVFGPVDPNTGKISKKAELDRNIYFGEGMVFLNDKIFQLTYKNQVCFVYDAKTFRKIKQYTYANKEGWGMTTDGTDIIMSDGTYVLTYLSPDDFHVKKSLQVSENNFAVDNLNELEYIKGFIYANVWTKNIIVKIDPTTGKIVGKLDLTALKGEVMAQYPRSLEMNGIAYDSLTDKIVVTGKMWPTMFQLDFTH